jgi:hypothetical protein
VAGEVGGLAIERRPARVEVRAAHLVVVFAAAGRQTEHEAPVREVVERRRLLGEQRRVGSQRRDQDVGHQADPLRDRGRRGERDQRLVARVRDPVDRAERRESGRLGSPRPLDYAGAVHAADRVRKPDPYVHPDSSVDGLR